MKIAAFLKLVLKTSQCWIWKGSIGGCGYGRIRIKGKLIAAHRLSWVLFKGRIPKGLYVLHKCDVRNCVRPSHLFVGTDRDNMRDKTRKGRTPHGEKHHWAKLEESDIRRIRELRERGMTLEKLAELFEVSSSNIVFIASRKSWKHVL